jgi:maltooligosyltrehalose trehalohydrolase
LIAIRRSDTALVAPDRDRMHVARVDDRTLALHLWTATHDVLTVLHFGDAPVTVPIAAPPGNWNKILDSADAEWLGPGSRVPDSLASSGEIKLSLAQHSAVVLARNHDRGAGG